MADQDKKKKRPAEPTLLAPRREEVVNGESVTFTWEPADRASGYRLVVATDNTLEEVVHEEELGTKTEHTVTDVFDTDGRTYFWHVEAYNEVGTSEPEHIESFVSSTAEETARMETEGGANDDEEYGPAGELVKSSSAAVAAEVTQDEAYFEEERRLGVAHEGVATGQIIAIAGSIILAIILLVLFLIFATDLTATQQRENVARTSRYPDLEEARNEAQQRLNNYGVVEDEEGAYRIPIDRAMELVIEESYQQQETAPSEESSQSQP